MTDDIVKEKEQNENFSTVIHTRNGWFDIDIRNIIQYRDLILLFVRREFVSKYKQTVLGPAWAIIQPLLTTVVFTIVFGNLAKLPTDGLPPFLFFMCGNIAWGYFSGCLTATASTFTANASVFGKVYFPRLVMPISTVLSQLISFAIQLLFFIIFLVIYLFVPGGNVSPNFYMLMLPLFLLQMAMLSLGFGIIVSALTTKYRDLSMLISFGVQLWMYATPIAYSVEIIPQRLMWLYQLNPMTPLIQAFRYAFLGAGSFDLMYYLIGWGTTLLVLLLGVLLFSRVEKTFIDTV